MTLRIMLKFDWIQEPLFQLEAPKDQPPEKDDGIIKPTTVPDQQEQIWNKKEISHQECTWPTGANLK